MVNYVNFPALRNANQDGLLAMGGDLSMDTLVSAYKQGIFPWFNDGQPILWWSPDPRLVLYPEALKISRSLRKTMRQRRFKISCDEAFEQVLKGCALRGAEKPFAVTPATWITENMRQAYTQLHAAGYAHSIEVWENKKLVGGLYGVVLGKVFFGESMFSEVSNASKLALVALCRWLDRLGFEIIDCQVANQHLFSLGAMEIPRSDFLQHLANIDIEQSSPNFSYCFDADDLLER